MQSMCVSMCTPQFHNHHLLYTNFSKPLLNISPSTTTYFNPFRLSLNQQKLMMPKKRSGMRTSGVVCSSSTLLSPRNLQWVSTVASVILMLVKGTSINRSFLVPFFALQAPASVMSWMQGEYGAWSALLTLLVRLFFFIPGELELPFATLVLILVAPRQAMNLRGTQAGVLVSLVIGAYLAFEHFIRVGGLQKSFNQESIVPTLAIICTAVVPFLLLI
ncbi:hypothetical protein vseg_011501 [Gypsophila vaccaria]